MPPGLERCTCSRKAVPCLMMWARRRRWTDSRSERRRDASRLMRGSERKVWAAAAYSGHSSRWLAVSSSVPHRQRGESKVCVCGGVGVWVGCCVWWCVFVCMYMYVYVFMYMYVYVCMDGHERNSKARLLSKHDEELDTR